MTRCYCASLMSGEFCETCQDVLYNSRAIIEGKDEEIDRLLAELTEARKPTCNACANFHSCWSRSWNNPSWAREHCPDGRLFERVAPMRLYEKEGK